MITILETSYLHRGLRRAGGLVALAALAALAPAAAAEEATAKSKDALQPEYRIGAHDVLDIAVWNNEQLSREIPVRPDGKISLPLIQDVPAAGLTPMELQEVLAERLAPYLADPQVSVMVREVNSSNFSVIGQVNEPGHYPLKGRMTVLDALAQAGGFTAYAAPSNMVVLRPTRGGTQRIAFNYNKQLRPKPGRDMLYLKPGDVVVVP
jgi:polysaccharide export outer membrane protein